jgi:hypothetical protein
MKECHELCSEASYQYSSEEYNHPPNQPKFRGANEVQVDVAWSVSASGEQTRAPWVLRIFNMELASGHAVGNLEFWDSYIFFDILCASGLANSVTRRPYNGNCTYVNGFPVWAKGLDVSRCVRRTDSSWGETGRHIWDHPTLFVVTLYLDTLLLLNRPGFEAIKPKSFSNTKTNQRRQWVIG